MSTDVDSPTTPAVPPEARPRKSRKSKAPAAPKVVKERKKREVPAMTWRRRVALRSSHAAEALARIVKRDPSFEVSIRSAISNVVTIAEDRARVDEAALKLREANDLLSMSESGTSIYAPVLARLDAEAKALAALDITPQDVSETTTEPSNN